MSSMLVVAVARSVCWNEEVERNRKQSAQKTAFR